MDGEAVESASADESSDKDGFCRENWPLTRLRSEGAAKAPDVSLDGGGSSEGSMPASSYQKRNK